MPIKLSISTGAVPVVWRWPVAAERVGPTHQPMGSVPSNCVWGQEGWYLQVVRWVRMALQMRKSLCIHAVMTTW